MNSAVDTSIVTTAPTKPLRAEELDLLDRYSRGELLVRLVRRSDLLARHPLLREPLLAEHVKPGLLAYWGTAPGLHLLYAHMNRVIKDRDLDALDITAPGHGGAGLVANAYLEGTDSEVYPAIGRDEDGLRALFRHVSSPAAFPVPHRQPRQ